MYDLKLSQKFVKSLCSDKKFKNVTLWFDEIFFSSATSGNILPQCARQGEMSGIDAQMLGWLDWEGAIINAQNMIFIFEKKPKRKLIAIMW